MGEDALGKLNYWTARRRRAAGMVLIALFLTAIAGAAGYVLYAPHAGPSPPAENRRVQAAHVDALVKEILDRPLFTPGRNPAPPPASPKDLAALRPPVLKSHLTGITIFPGTRLAVFVSEENKYRSVGEGEEIDGFKVRSISADQVILASAFGEQILRPAKANYETVRNTKPVEMGSFDPDKP